MTASIRVKVSDLLEALFESDEWNSETVLDKAGNAAMADFYQRLKEEGK